MCFKFHTFIVCLFVSFFSVVCLCVYFILLFCFLLISKLQRLKRARYEPYIYQFRHTHIHTHARTYTHTRARTQSDKYTCIYIHTFINTYMDVSVAEWLAWLTSNCGRIGAIGSSPSNGLRPNM